MENRINFTICYNAAISDKFYCVLITLYTAIIQRHRLLEEKESTLKMAARQQECGICMESCKNPWQISCHHSFCCKCLEDYVQVNLRKGRFDCPICRTNVELPKEGVRCFETKSCTDTNSDEKFACDLCGLKSVACSRCLDCEENLCQSCCYVHEKLKVSRHHKVRDLGTLDSAMKGKLRQRTFCDQHPEEEIKLMCRDCNILVCVLCKAVDHENHATKTVADVAAEMKKTLLTKMTSFSGKLRNISTSKEKAEELESSIDGAEREELKSVEDQHSQLNQVLGQEVAKVKATITNVYRSLRQQNTILKRDIHDELRTCSDVYENAQKLTQQGSDIEIIKKGSALGQLISEAISKTDQMPNIHLKNKLFSPAEIKKSELIVLIGKMQDSTDSSPETEASTPVVEKENKDPKKGTKDEDKVIAMETTSSSPTVNEEVVDTVDVNSENEDRSDLSVPVGNEKNEKLKLKYKYKKDQWSPINHEGKKQYDRDFLLQLQNAPESMLKPLDLPDIPDIIIEKPSFCPGNRDFAEGSNFVDFIPRYVWSGGPNRSGGVPRKSSGQRDMGGPGGSAIQSKHINLLIPRDIELQHAKEAWNHRHRAEKIDKGDMDLKSEELYKKVRSILDKFTPQKLQTVVAKMQALEIDTEARLKNVIDLVYEKAISEPRFSVAYANMCRCLSMFKVRAESRQGYVNFHALLLTRCQQEFEKSNSSEKEFDSKRKEIKKATMDEKQQMKEELEYDETKTKRRCLENISFIGELFKLKMLTENIIHDCVFKLLRTKDEENLECLCRLLKTIGKELDTDKAKPRMNQYFQQMLKIVNEKKLSSRVRFMLQDVIELRRGKWVPRRDDSNPKTIDQIHQEVTQEAQDQAKPQKGNLGRPGQPSGPMGSGADGWNTVSQAPLRTDRSIDPTKLKLSEEAYYNPSSMRPSGYQISQPQPSQGLYTQEQIMFMPPPQYSAATQQVIMPMTASSYPQRMSSPAYQNSMPNTQQGLFQLPQQNTANYTPHAHTHTYNNPPAVFYNAAQQNRPPSASGMSGPGQLPAKKRERTVLIIIDPNSGKDILQDLQARSTPPSSGTLGSHGSGQEFQVPHTAQNEIAAQFAAQAAQIALSTCPGGNQPRIVPDAEDIKKDVRGRKKAKDIKRKEEMRKGSKMDAFIDSISPIPQNEITAVFEAKEH